jgi:glycosyltransferase involved in cell wall biosynthesis
MKSASPILTIAIPTYNRAAKLQAQLERLLPQLTPEVRLCVYDNASPDDTQAVVAKFPGVAYFRAAINCGAGRNIFRCFEECQTEWLWVLSDDDPASKTGVNDLLTVLRQQACDFIHFSTYFCVHDATVVVDDVASLLTPPTFFTLLTISAGVYRIPAFRPLYGVYNESLSTWAPHLLMMLSLVESRGGKVLLSHKELLIRTPVHTIRWSSLDFILRISLAPEYLLLPANRTLLASCILLEYYHGSLLRGLREATQAAKIQRWQQIRQQAYENLKAYRARGCGDYFIHNWFRAGHRRQSLGRISNAFMVNLLGWCPVHLFRPLMKLLPLPKSVKVECFKRSKYVPGY